MENIQLTPPQYTFVNKIKYTYGLSPYIDVQDLDVDTSPYTLMIKVCNDTIANSLRRVLPFKNEMGNIEIEIHVLNSEGTEVLVSEDPLTPEELSSTFYYSLYGNPLFIGTVLTEAILPPMVKSTVGDVVIIIDKSIVQFYNDDIGDLCSNYNEVAAKVFEDISNLEYPSELFISFSTLDCNCEIQKNMYCRYQNPCN